MHDPIRLLRDRIAIQIQNKIRVPLLLHKRPIAAGPRNINTCTGAEELRAERVPHPQVLGDAWVVDDLRRFEGYALRVDVQSELDAHWDFVGGAVG